MKSFYSLSLLSVLFVGLMVARPYGTTRPPGQVVDVTPGRTVAVTGQSKTLMPNGHLLILGGETPNGALNEAATEDPATGVITPLAQGLLYSRAWHSATLLPNGTVLIFGGTGTDGKIVTTSELYDPASNSFTSLDTPGLTYSAHHTATLLTDGTVFIAGGVSEDGETLARAELWNSQTESGLVLSTQLETPRHDQSATLLANGEVLLWGGLDRNGVAISYGEVFDPGSTTFSLETIQERTSEDSPTIVESIPANNAQGVSVNSLVVFRFSRPLQVTTVNLTGVVLAGPSGTIPASIVPAESGMLAFLTPASPLLPATDYSVTLSGAEAPDGKPLPVTTITFETTGAPANGTGLLFGPASGNQDDNTYWQALPPLQAPRGATALAGQSLTLLGLPVEDLTIEDESSGTKTETDRTGRFLLQGIGAGHHVLFVDGRTASNRGSVYGTYEIGIDITNGQTNILSYTIWMTQLDTVHAVTIPSPTTSETVITNPSLPGLELHLPKGTLIVDHDGKVVTQVSITPIPESQPPFPLPQGVKIPIYFTIQPGGAYLSTNGDWLHQGAQLYYPNFSNARAGTQFNFWNYNPNSTGWYVYGQGTVSPSRTQVIPNPGVEIYRFTGAMVDSTASNRPNNFGNPGGPQAGEPVDLSSGLFVYKKTDLTLPDLLPLELTRTYRPGDSQSRAFGIGTSQDYDMFLTGDVGSYTYIELILADGSRIRYNRTSTGGSGTYTNAVYLNSLAGTRFYGSMIAWNGNGWNLTLNDGTVYTFPDSFSATTAQQGALTGIHDRYGNTISITRDTNSNLTQITSPNGRWIQFTYDSSNRVTQAQDNIGRTVSYSYDSSGRLSTATDANGGMTTFTYDSSNEMLTITDPRGIVYLTNVYDSNGHVIEQTQPDGITYNFAWTTTGTSSRSYGANGGTGGVSTNAVMAFRDCTTCSAGYSSQIASVQITDPRGYIRQVTLDANGNMISDIRALGQPEQQIITHQYYADGLLESVTDSLNRTTNYVYDANNNLTQLTRLSGTSSAVASSFTYESTFNQLSSASDPLGHTTYFSHDTNGNLTSVTDPLNHQTSFTYNSAGQLATVTDPLSHTTSFGYDSGDLVSITDPLSRATTRFVDGAGRLITVTDPLGDMTRNQYDALNELTKVTDPLGNATQFSYDGNGNLLTVTDANSHQTSYAYNLMDRLVQRTDPLSNSESYAYDANGNLTQFTDRRGKVTAYTYDGIDRRTFAGFGQIGGMLPSYESSISYNYDDGNRLTSVTDSVAGTITPQFDELDRLVSESTPQGTVTYDYNPASRRTSMKVAGQTSVAYSYDSANRLTGLTQGSAAVSFSYDNANKRTSLTLPNGVEMSYSYDNASELTGITYTNGGTALGTLTYAYDLAGRRNSLGGSYAATELPIPVGGATYDADNQLTQWGTASLYYDADGNMTSDGSNSYVWNARNQLASMNFGSDSFEYDAYGRRTGKTISSATTNYLYDGANPVQELSGSTPTANILGGLTVDERFTRTDSMTTANFLTDALGSTIALTDPSVSTLASYGYEPFGNTNVTSGSSTNPYQYTGRENDGTGLYFNRARYYSPTLQRFISEDPAFPAGGINGYAYASNNPVFWADPFGLNPTPVTPWDRLRLLGEGGLQLAFGLGKFGIGTGAGLAAPETGGLSLGLTYYGYLSGAGNIVSAGADIYGALTGNVQTAQTISNVATIGSSVSGGVTYLATGNVNASVNAANIEGLGVAGFQGGVNAAEGEGLSLADTVETLETGAGLLATGTAH